jgi:hypothetical protein
VGFLGFFALPLPWAAIGAVPSRPRFVDCYNDEG